eukprot:TRINITY_DN9025_c0_g1_i1.p1 TRINITY_DN9025_c0_g1~~TRINITY_DN9025_c0_g1_i1.p1  ORF type:complete len:461 (-),score=81.92 TRINITY_DN9025_c0_g1_i1:21-1403(-)
MKKYEVVVVGAGVSGLRAALTLIENGIKVEDICIVEARDRPGGRVFTDKKTFSVPIDFGAHWVHTFWSNPLVKLALKHKVDMFPNEYQRAGIYKGGERINRKMVKKARIRFNYVLTALENDTFPDSSSILDAVEVILKKLTPPEENTSVINEIVMAFLFHLMSDSAGLELSDLNLNCWKSAEQDFDVDGGDQLPEGGMWSLFEKEFEPLYPIIRYNSVVSNIDYSDPTIIRVTTNNGTFPARYVLVTVPISLLKQDKIKFSPSLPERQTEALKWFRMGLLNCVTIQFESTFWNEDDEFLLYLPPVSSTPPNSPFPPPADFTKVKLFTAIHHTKPGLLLAWTIGRQADLWENLSDADQLKYVTETLLQMYPKLPKVTQFAVTRWKSDPFSLGSYSAPELGYAEKQNILSEVIVSPGGSARLAGLFFAGEALADRFATVHGAYLSGEAQAKKILSFMHNSKL